jgi:predicted MPP superfamily phosphohydrolase
MPWTLRMLLMFALVGALFQFYVGLKMINAVSNLTDWPKRRARIIAIAVACWLSLYPLLMLSCYLFKFNRVSQAFQTANLPRDLFFTFPFWIGVIFAIQIAMPFLLIDATRLLLFPLYKKHKLRWLKAQSLLMIGLAAASLIYVIARVYSDTFTLRTTEGQMRIQGLPKELDGFRIAQIADMQADGRTNGQLLQAYIDRINQLTPDLILFGGDMVTGGTDYIETGGQAMGKMQARYGVYACLGDHDFFSNRDMVVKSLEENGVTLLDNSAKLISVGSASISLTGITNVYRTRPSAQALASLEQGRPQAAVSILLTHQPSEWLVDYAAKRGYDLLTAGHTHGGQIVFPLPGFLLTGSSFETAYVTGFYKAGPMLVSINNGLGLTLAAVRYNAPAEITVITLRAAE